MSGYEKRTRFYLLDCYHKVELAEPGPSKGDEQFCFKCNRYRDVTQALVNYRSKCRSCKGTRNLGDDEQEAFIWARKHISIRPKHIVDIRKDGEKIGEVTNTSEDLFTKPSELNDIATKAQQLLRDTFQAEEIVTYEEGAFPF